jgi:hypothetical protein
MRTKSLLVLLALCLLTACQKTTPVDSQQATTTLMPSLAPTGEPTIAPTPSPTLALSPTFTPDRSSKILTPTAVSTLPVSTPAAAPGNYRLREWTEADALDAIREGESYLKAWDADKETWSFKYRGYDYDDYLLTLAEEFIHRFPQSPEWNQIAWQLTHRQVVSSNYTGIGYTSNTVEWFRALLEASFNSGEVQLPRLATWLKPRGFELRSRTAASNLFGDGQPAEVLEIAIEEHWLYVVFILIGEQPGGQRLVALDGMWHSLIQSDETITVADRNGNAQTEIQIITEWWGVGFTHICRSNLKLLEWRAGEERFVNLAEQVQDVHMNTDLGECAPWKFDLPDANGIQTVIAVEEFFTWNYSLDPCPNYIHQTVYSWNGDRYEKSAEILDTSPISVSARCALYWAYRVGGANDQALSLLSAAIEDWLPEVESEFGPDARDYFRLKLGIWYALRDQRELAIAALTGVRDQPYHPEFAMASEIARAFLDGYEIDLHAACVAANQVLALAEESQVPLGSIGPDVTKMREVWGFADNGWDFSPWLVVMCDSDATFLQALQKMDLHNLSALEQAIDRLLIPRGEFMEVDLDGNEYPDWLVAMCPNQQGDRRICQTEIWAFIYDKDTVIPMYLDDTYSEPENLNSNRSGGRCSGGF